MKTQKTKWTRANKGCLVLAVLLAVFSAAALPVQAQERSRTSLYLKEAADVLSGLMKAAEDRGFRLEKSSMTLAGGWIDQGSDWTALYQLKLERGGVYRFVAAGDVDSIDVDIRITDPSGAVVAKDEGTARTAVIDFVPRQNVYYTVHVRVYTSTNRVSCVCLTAAYKK